MTEITYSQNSSSEGWESILIDFGERGGEHHCVMIVRPNENEEVRVYGSVSEYSVEQCEGYCKGNKVVGITVEELMNVFRKSQENSDE